MRPLTSATSIWRSTPSVNASSAPVRSCRSTPTSSAKWLRVPAGMHANAIPCAAATAATTASDPSPPATPSTSAPPAAASRASAARSCPGSRTTASTPRSRARSASPARAALPPPDLGLTNSTGQRGGSTGRQPEADPAGVSRQIHRGFLTDSRVLILQRAARAACGRSAAAARGGPAYPAGTCLGRDDLPCGGRLDEWCPPRPARPRIVVPVSLRRSCHRIRPPSFPLA